MNILHQRRLHLSALCALVLCGPGLARAQDARWGTIKGRLIWGSDKLPPPAVLTLPADAGAAGCIQANKGKLPPDETWVVNQKNKGLRDAFIWLAAADKKPLPIHPDLKDIKVKEVVIDQPACHFIPHAVALREGQTLLVKDSAPFPHNFMYAGIKRENQGNPSIPSGGEVRIKLLADRFPIRAGCGTHGWMKSWVGVFDHPYFAVTDENGAFEIKNAPAGNYRLMVWHGSSGWKGGADGRDGDPVTIQPGPVVDLGNIAFPPPPKD